MFLECPSGLMSKTSSDLNALGSSTTGRRPESDEPSAELRSRVAVAPGPALPWLGSRRASSSQVEEQTPVERALDPPMPLRTRAVTVADRVRALTQGGRTSASSSALIDDRARPFSRRNSRAAPIELDAPLAQSRAPLQTPRILSPHPCRIRPPLSSTVEQTSPLLMPQTGNEFSNAPAGSRRRQSTFSDRGRFGPVPESAFAPGTVMCPRHGRKLTARKSTISATTDGLEKSKHGAYVPTGAKTRHQVEATSPWYTPAENLTNREGAALSPDICTDCRAEQDIKRRELVEAAECAVAANDNIGGSAHYTDRCSTFTEPGTPFADNDDDAFSIVGTADDHQALPLPGAAVAGIPFDKTGSVVAADLGDMIDAIIIEHRGALNRVITNLRDGTPESLKLQRLSRNLANISESIAAVPIVPDATRQSMNKDSHSSSRPCSGYSVILDTPPEFLQSRTQSVPDLLDFIDSAAKDLGLYTRLATPQTDVMERDARLHRHSQSRRSTSACTTLTAHPPTLHPETSTANPLASAYATANHSPVEPAVLDSPVLESPDVPSSLPGAFPDSVVIGRPAVEDQIRQQVLSKIDSQSPAQATSVPPNTPYSPPQAPQTPLPSEVLQSRHLSPEADMPEPARVSSPIVQPSFSQTSTLPTAALPVTQSPSRIPERKPSITNVNQNARKYMPFGNSVRTPTAPWNNASSASSGPRTVAMKPSQVREQQKMQQGTFPQPWLREGVKSPSWKMRAEKQQKRMSGAWEMSGS